MRSEPCAKHVLACFALSHLVQARFHKTRNVPSLKLQNQETFGFVGKCRLLMCAFLRTDQFIPGYMDTALRSPRSADGSCFRRRGLSRSFARPEGAPNSPVCSKQLCSKHMAVLRHSTLAYLEP